MKGGSCRDPQKRPLDWSSGPGLTGAILSMLLKTPPKAPSVGARQRPCAKSVREALGIQFELAPAGQVRMRRLVHRGAPRPVFKLHSIKLARRVECESKLEVDVAVLLDASPAVTLFAEQPLALHYLDRQGWRRHVPDFMVQMGQRREFIEVKFEADVDDEIRYRTGLLVESLAPHGWEYRILSEVEVRCGPYLENAQKLLRRGRQRPPEHWSLSTFDRIRKSGSIAIGEFGWGKTSHIETVWIAHEILVGHVNVDLSQSLSPDSLLYVGHPELGGLLPWQV